jgi:NAD(P)-dependent dehydrogenase (short-subunit alcohol dehydrogenase family)
MLGVNENLKGKVGVITGGSGVLCRSMAKELARQGVKVAILNRNKESGEEVVHEIKESGGQAISIPCDVTNVISVKRAEEIIIRELGICNILINGAGGNHPDGTTTNETFKLENLEDKEIKTFFDLDQEAFGFVFDLNILGTLIPTQVFTKNMINKRDVLYIHSLDRFGRNKEEILQEWNDITKNIQADIVVLDMPLLDTTQFKDSLGTFIADLVLQILSWMAEEERDRIRKRQREGIDLALQNGTAFGRPKATITEEFEQVYDHWKSGEMAAVKAMQEIGVKKTTFYKLVREYEDLRNKSII